MAAKIIPLNKKKKPLKQLIEEAISSNHNNLSPQVLKCLKHEVEKILTRHYADCDIPEVTIQLPSDLSTDQFMAIHQSINDAFVQHNEMMIERANAIFLDLYHSRLEYCELKYGDPGDGR